MLPPESSFIEGRDPRCLVTLRFRDLLLLVAHCCHVFPSELYTNGFDSRAFNTSHNKIYLRFIVLLAALVRRWEENGNYGESL